jgi:acetoin utilization deacetylase AcuC-like enzyme
MKLGLISHKAFEELHNPELTRPWMEAFENPNRIKLTREYLHNSGLLNNQNLKNFECKPATREDIIRVHNPYLFDVVNELSSLGSGEVGSSSVVVKDTFRAACLSAGGAISTVDEVNKGSVETAFALIRPPGHHAGIGHSEGMCYFNNCAIAVRWLQEKKKVKRVLILDLDAHACDGTTQIFYTDPTVFCLSFHEYGMEAIERGWLEEIGSGEGEGYNINVPLPFGTWGTAYRWAFEQIFPEILRDFKPEMLVVSFGFDTHYSDPVGNMNLQAEDYAQLTRIILQLGKEVCGGKIAFILEGGYSLLALPLSIGAVISTILDTQIKYFDKIPEPEKIPKIVRDVTEEIQNIKKQYL